MLERFDYIIYPQEAGRGLAERVRTLLIANGRPKTCAHVFAVAAQARLLALRFGENAEAAEEAPAAPADAQPVENTEEK